MLNGIGKNVRDLDWFGTTHTASAIAGPTIHCWFENIKNEADPEEFIRRNATKENVNDFSWNDGSLLSIVVREFDSPDLVRYVLALPGFNPGHDSLALSMAVDTRENDLVALLLADPRIPMNNIEYNDWYDYLTSLSIDELERLCACRGKEIRDILCRSYDVCKLMMDLHDAPGKTMRRCQIRSGAATATDVLLFAIICLVADGFLVLKSTDVAFRTWLNIAVRLPMDLQIVLALRTTGKSGVKITGIEEAIKKMLGA